MTQYRPDDVDEEIDLVSELADVAFFIHRRAYFMVPPLLMPRLAHIDALCSLCKISRARGNGFAFSYPPFVQYQPRGVA